MHNQPFSEGQLPTFRAGLGKQMYESARRCFEQQQYVESLNIVRKALQDPLPRGVGEAEPSVSDGVILAAWNLHQLRQYDECRAWLRKAFGEGMLAEGDPDAVLIELWLKWSEGRYQEIVDEAEPYIIRFTGQLHPLLAEFLFIRGNTLLKLGQLDSALEDCGTAYAFFKILQKMREQAEVCNVLGIIALQRSRYEDALKWLMESLEINEELEIPRRIGDNYLNIGVANYKKGHYDQAQEYLTLAAQVHEQIESPHLLCRAKIALGNVCRLLRDFSAARSNLMMAYTLATERRLTREECLALEFLGDVLRDEGKPREARRYYGRGLTIARKIAPEGDLVLELMRRDGECLELLDRPEEATRVLESARRLATKQEDRLEEGVILRCLAVAAARQRDWRRAEEYIQAAITNFEEIRARHEQAVAQLWAARFFETRGGRRRRQSLRAGDLEQALQHAVSAQNLFRQLGIDYWNQEADRVVSSLAWLHLASINSRDKAPGIVSTTEGSATQEVVAVSSFMRSALQQADSFADFGEPVLVTGDTGTGKELIARRIHGLSSRRQQPFVAVNCAAIPLTLFEREFFGHCKGAYTGAESDQPGFVTQAEGGTLFLDEVGELPLELQPKLLRLLQDGTFTRLGDPEERTADIRLIAATNADLDRLVTEGRFRQDLNFRLKVLEVALTPLRDRRDDILPVLQHYLSQLAGHQVTVWHYFNNESVQALRRHDWPGNVREVIMVARRAHISLQSSGHTEVQLGSNADSIRLAGPARRRESYDGTRRRLLQTLEETHNNKAESARRLGVSRQTLYRWLRRYGVNS